MQSLVHCAQVDEVDDFVHEKAQSVSSVLGAA